MLNSTEYKNDIVEFFNVLSEEECNQLINYFNSDESQWQVTCFYGSRVMDPYINLNDSSHITREYLDNLRIKFKDIALNVCKKDLKLHGVSEIKTGTRYTMLASFDYTDSTYDRDLLEWRKEYSIEQEEQRKNWDSLNQ